MPAARSVVNEGSTAYLTVDFLDKVDAAAAPTSISYRIDDAQSGAEVRADSAVAAASQIEIELTVADNTLLGAGDVETRVVTVTATYGADDEVSDNYFYDVKNLRFKS